MPITPKDIAENAIMDWVTTGYGWLVTAVILVFGFIWRASKEHGKYESLRSSVQILSDQQKLCITGADHEAMQQRCQEHLMHVMDAKLITYERANARDMKELREEVHNLNANICKLMGAQGVEPIVTGKRRRDDP